MKLYLNADYIHNERISNEAFLVYIALACLDNYDAEYAKSNFVITECYVNARLLYARLAGDFNYSRRSIESIKRGLDELISLRLVTVLYTGQHDMIVDLTNMRTNIHNSDGYYCTIYTEDIRKIVKSFSTNVAAMARFYTYVCSTLMTKDKKHYKKGIGYLPKRKMAEDFGAAEKTIYNYMNALQEAEVVYTYKSGHVVVSNENQIISIPTLYGRYVDIDLIVAAGKEVEENFRQWNKTSKVKHNSTHIRTKLQKYKAWLNGRIYSDDELFQIYDALQQYNDKYKDKPERQYDDAPLKQWVTANQKNTDVS